nr:MFS transporter [uncultured Nocardioides sp.]
MAATVLGSGLAGIDATVVSVALPSIGRSFDASFAELQWVVTAYVLTLAAFILVGGALGDRFGRRRVFVGGVVWFAVASLLCALAPTPGLLVAGRALQGVGAALFVPGSLAIIQSSVTPADRARAVGAWSGLGGVASAAGPFVGGWLVNEFAWNWIFLVNVPLTGVVVWATLHHVPETCDASAPRSLDWAGGVLGAAALAGLSYALIAAGASGSAGYATGAAALGVVAAVAFVVVERRSSHPMLPFRLFSSPQFTATNIVTFIIYGAFGVVFLLVVVELQVVSGYGPVAAGASLLPVTGLMLLLSPQSGKVSARIGPRLQMSVGPLVCAVGLLLMLRIGVDAPFVTVVLPGILVFGLGLSVLVAPLTSSALDSVPADHAGLASGVNNAVARTGGLVAVAAIPALVGLTGRVYESPVAFDAGFDKALWTCVVLLTIGGVVAAVTIDNPVRTSATQPRRVHLRHCTIAAPPPVVQTGPTRRSGT